MIESYIFENQTGLVLGRSYLDTGTPEWKPAAAPRADLFIISNPAGARDFAAHFKKRTGIAVKAVSRWGDSEDEIMDLLGLHYGDRSSPSVLRKVIAWLWARLDQFPGPFCAGDPGEPVSRKTAALEWKDTAYGPEAILGNFEAGDGVRFSIAHQPTCQRRGPWKLLIEVSDLAMDWGCFDDQDQPVRFYHSDRAAREEAESIAKVLVREHEAKVARSKA